MGCEEIRDLLALYAGGESYDSERSAVEAHVAVCAACARDLDLYREDRANLAALREGAVPASTFKSMWSGVRSDLFPKKAANRLALLDAALRYAAVLMVGLALGVVIHFAERRQDSAPAAPGAPRISAVNLGTPVQPATLAPSPNAPRFFIRTNPRLPALGTEPDGNFHLPRVEAMPAGSSKDF